jgi:hypothetical protein
MSGQNELFKKLYGKSVSDVSQQELFDELAAAVPPEDFTATLKKLADEATAATVAEKRAEEEAHLAYSKAASYSSWSWRDAWMRARRKLIRENNNERR